MDDDDKVAESPKDETAIDIPTDVKPPLTRHSSSLAEIVVDNLPKEDGNSASEQQAQEEGVKEVAIDLPNTEGDDIEQDTLLQHSTDENQNTVMSHDDPPITDQNDSENIPPKEQFDNSVLQSNTRERSQENLNKMSPRKKSSTRILISDDSFDSDRPIRSMKRPNSAQVGGRTKQNVPLKSKRPDSAPGRRSNEKESVDEVIKRFRRKKTLDNVMEDQPVLSENSTGLIVDNQSLQNDSPLTTQNEEKDEANDFIEEKNVKDLNNNESIPDEEVLQQKTASPIKKEHSFILPPLSTDEELPWAMYQKIKKREDEEGAIPQEEFSESESDDEKYVAEKNDDLPDMYEVMEGLDDEKIDLNLKTTPPDIFDTTGNQLHKKEVVDLKQGLAEEEIKIYLDEFEERVKQEVLMIGNISLEDVQEEERRLRQEHITFQQQQALVQRQRQQEIMQAMERARKYVMAKYKEKYRDLRMREQHLMQKDRSYKDEIHRAFRRSESQLRKALKKRKAEVKTMYGDLTFADGQYGGSKGRRWKIDWNRTPQPIQIKLKCLRGVKDKLPASRYVLMVSLYNRLGGNVMKWSNLKGQQWGGATLPIWHDGEFFNIEIKIDQSVFTVCPSRPDIRPGMVLVFELFILRGSITPTDKVVGWGCFPICDADFNVIEGRYKTPLLRGDMDPSIDKFSVMEKLMADDLENWLCNFYFEIIRLPRYMAGQKEYEVELQFTSGILGAPDRTKTSEENIDGENAIFGSKSDLGSSAIFSHSSRSNSIVSSNHENDTSDSSSMKKPSVNVLMVDNNNGEGSSSGRTSSRGKHSITESQVKLFRAENLSADLRKRKQTYPHIANDEMELSRPMTSVAASRVLVEERGLQLSDDESESDYSDQEVYAVKKDEGFKPVKGHPGMFYKIHHNTPSDIYARKMFTLMPKTPLIGKEKTRKKLTHLEQLDTHSYCVKTTWSNKGRIEHKGTKKFQYIGRMMLSELGISQIKSREFWAMILMLLLTYWMRMYCHYIGQWVALLGFLVPLNRFEFLPYTVVLNYQNTLLRTREEIALIVIGPFTNILLLLVMLMISGFIQFLFDRFPNIFSRFLMAFGLHCIMDPIWILITDSALQRYENRGGEFPIGDAFKLYWHFDRFYNNDNVTLFVSIALTTFLYFVTIFCACVIVYIYFLRIHNNGRLMDVYWRLHGKDDSFFIPYDLELSLEELTYVCRKAENWRGEEGERRKTAVYDYIWEEEQLEESNWDELVARTGQKMGTKEVTTHVSVHTLHLDGLRELYRHFLRLPDGAIVEVFGEMNIPGIDEGVKQALIKRTNFQSSQPSQDNLRKRHSRASSASSATGREYVDTHQEGTFDRLVIPGSSQA